MAITKVINVEVNTGDATQELNKLEGSFKDVDKQAAKTDNQLQKVGDNGGAIAVLDSVTGGMATRLRDAAEASKLFNFSLKGMRTALIATGIGALVVALGLIVAYWDDIVILIQGANKELEKQIILHQRNLVEIKREVEQLDLIIELEKKRGNNIDDLIKKKKELLKEERLETQDLIGKQKLLLENLLIEAKRLTIAERFSKEYTLSGGKKGGGIINEEEQKAIDEANTTLDELEKRLIKIDILLTPDKEEEVDEKVKKETKRDPLEKVEGVGFDAEASQREFEEREEANALKLQQELEFNIGLEEIGLTSARIRHDTEIKWADLTAQAKLGIAGAVLQDAAGLVDKNSVAGKGIAIAQTGINTSQGIMQAFATLPTIAAIPAAAIVGALGIKSTLDIAKKKIPSATGRGFVSGGASGGAPVQAPSFNLVEGTSDNQISNDIQGIGQEPVRAVVVSGDVTTGQSVDRNIITESGI